MSKYINADKLCEDLMTRWKIADEKKEKEIQSIMADVVTPIVVGQPSADVVEVVRCKDCKKYKPLAYPYLCGECGNCSYDFPAKIVKEDGYCDEGERKDNDK